MGISLVGRFVDAFIAGFFKTMKERLIDGGLLSATLLYWFFSGKLRAHLWESIVPWVWVLCSIVFWHTISAAILLLQELKREEVDSRYREKSLILSQYGDPLELPKTEVREYRAKIFGIVAMVVAVCLICSYAVSRVAQHEDIVQAPIVAVPPSIPDKSVPDRPLTGFMQLGELFFRPQNYVVKGGGKLELNASYINRGSEPVQNAFGWTTLVTIDHPAFDADRTANVLNEMIVRPIQ